MTDLANLVQRLRAIGLATADEAATALEHLLLERDAVRRITVEEAVKECETRLSEIDALPKSLKGALTEAARGECSHLAARIRALAPTPPSG
jgi:hypothetical protein